MYLTRRLAALAAAAAALAMAVPASADTPPAGNPGLGSPHCPVGYSGPTNLATGCPWWIMVR
jgi:hypothetical protein